MMHRTHAPETLTFEADTPESSPELCAPEPPGRVRLAGGNLLLGRDELFARIVKLYSTSTPLL